MPLPNKPIVTLVGGGVRCGKSGFALARAYGMGAKRGFIATAQAFDDEMRDRIANHKAERAGQFTTIEAPFHVAQAVRDLQTMDVVVIDCLTLWLSNLLMADLADADVYAELDGLIAAIAGGKAHVVLVTNEVGLGIVPSTPLGRRFRDLAGRVHQRCASVADEIFFGALGCMLRLHPSPVCLVTAHQFATVHPA